VTFGRFSQNHAALIYPRTSEAKDCSQNANLHRPLMDMGMLEKSQLNYETIIRLEIQFYLGFV
jgi:hypothetical protein